MESSEHFTNKPAYFTHVAKTLKPGGMLLLAAWTGDMRSERIRAVARDFLCPELLTAEQYAELIEVAGLKIRKQEDLSAKVERTWEICRERARKARPLVLALPARHRRFVDGIDLILEAYGSGELTYTVIAASKP
jgi:tocopherol O-methyltransferase